MLSQLGSYPSLGLRVDPLWFTALIDTGSSKRDLNFSQVLELDVLGQFLGRLVFWTSVLFEPARLWRTQLFN